VSDGIIAHLVRGTTELQKGCGVLLLKLLWSYTLITHPSSFIRGETFGSRMVEWQRVSAPPFLEYVMASSARKHQGSEKVSLGITSGIVLKGKPSECYSTGRVSVVRGNR
jgi:hypothetical protein